jgi:hypothetical protein
VCGDLGYFSGCGTGIPPLIDTSSDLSGTPDDLEEYTLEKDLEDDHILVSDKYGTQYVVEYGVGCLGMWRHEGETIHIDVGGAFLDGIGDTIYLLDDDDTCRVWEADEVEDVGYAAAPGLLTFPTHLPEPAAPTPHAQAPAKISNKPAAPTSSVSKVAPKPSPEKKTVPKPTPKPTFGGSVSVSSAVKKEPVPSTPNVQSEEMERQRQAYLAYHAQTSAEDKTEVISIAPVAEMISVPSIPSSFLWLLRLISLFM